MHNYIEYFDIYLISVLRQRSLTIRQIVNNSYKISYFLRINSVKSIFIVIGIKTDQRFKGM